MLGIIKLFFTGLLLFLPATAFAFGLSPSALDVSINPGGSGSIDLVLSNDLDESVDYAVSIYQAEIGEAQTDLSFLPISIDDGIEFSFNSQVGLSAYEVKEISVEILSTAQVQPGEYVFGVIVEEVSENDSFRVKPALSSMIFVTVEGELVEDVNWLDFQSSKKYYFDLPIDFYLTVQNNGERTVQPSGLIAVTSWLGNNVELIDINPTAYRTLEGQTRTYNIEWGKSFAIGVYRILLEVSAWDDGEFYYDEITVVVLPWKSILGVIIVLFLVSLILIRKKKKI